MDMSEAKRLIVEALESRGVYMRMVHESEYVTRCPYCGDSSKRINTGHMYVYINEGDSSAVKFYCHKCPANGRLTQKRLNEDFGVDDPAYNDAINFINKRTVEKDRRRIVNDKRLSYSYTIPPIVRGPKIYYLENRLHRNFSDEELSDMKVITSLKAFLKHNKIPYMRAFPLNILSILERDYVGFLSYGSSHILFRDTTGKNERRWMIYPITEEVSKSDDAYVMYVISTTIDIFSEEPVVVNISEGILDILSAAYALSPTTANTMNIAVCGKYYMKAIMFIVELGLFGDNVRVNIILDNDKDFNPKGYNPKEETFNRKVFESCKNLFGRFSLVINTKSKDIGVPREEIALKVTNL